MNVSPSEPASSRPAPPPVGGGRLSSELQGLLDAFSERAVRVREVLEVTHGRGFNLLLILLAFPFCTPIPLPGVSTPFGLVIAFVGLRLALGQKPWLPARLLDKRLPPRFFPRFLAATRRLVRGLEFCLKPRGARIMQWPLVRRCMGLMIFCAGLLLLLPLPIPFSNFLPALTVVLLAAALLEDDGCVAVAGGGVFLLTLAFFTAIFWGGTEVINWLEQRFGGILDPDYEQPTGP
jgi:hypothetical protein